MRYEKLNIQRKFCRFRPYSSLFLFLLSRHICVISIQIRGRRKLICMRLGFFSRWKYKHIQYLYFYIWAKLYVFDHKPLSEIYSLGFEYATMFILSFLSKFFLVYLKIQCWNSSVFNLSLLTINFLRRLFTPIIWGTINLYKILSIFTPPYPMFLLSPRPQT